MKQSPFKFLDAYEKQDKDIFFGRETEVDALYQMTYQTNLMLVYGMSGTGKTSLIQCGLANCFESSDWFAVPIRRQENINSAMIRELRSRDAEESFEADFTLPQMVHSLYLDYLRPIYLIFDQFEELYILGSEEEQEVFIRAMHDLLSADLPCKVVIAIREEYLAHLSNFERSVPRLFDKRLRVEPMTRANARRVILETAKNPKFNILLCADEVADAIIDSVTGGVGRVQLTYLQVFLDKMYRMAWQRDATDITFDEDLVREVGKIEDVLSDFLNEQIDVFAKEIANRDEALRWLRIFVSEKGTKLPVKRHDLIERLPEMSEPKLNIFLEFFVNRRILRPLDNDQYELTHDSLAAFIFQTHPKGTPVPELSSAYSRDISPFAGFAPYSQAMAAQFFGREEEIAALFNQIVNETHTRLTLVFGQMGVGKTSLILAGLIPRLEVLYKTSYLRINREWTNSALVRELLSVEPQPGELPVLLDIAFENAPVQPSETDRKVIIFDQFEEAFVWMQAPGQLLHFYLHIAHLLEARRNCDVVLVVRDEFFSQLQDMEAFIPNILEEQFRVRPVDVRTAAHIITQMAERAGITFDPPDLVQRIVAQITEPDGKVNLTYLQLYMERLYAAAG